MNRKRAFVSRRARIVVALAATLWSLVCAAQFGNPRFSPDEEHLAFDYCQPKCHFVVYSSKTGAAITFEAPKDESWINPSFGVKRNHVIFVVIKDPSHTQIATIELDGTGFRRLTNSPVIKRSPNVSPDGRQVIFAGGSKTVTERGSFSSVDVYITDIDTREERRITDLRVLDIGAPFFLPDGRKITFATVGSAIPRSQVPPQSVPLEKLYPNRTVFVQSPNELAELEPILHVPLIAAEPTPISRGEIALRVRVNELDQLKGSFVHDIFLAKDGKAVRLTKFRSYVWSYGISGSGELVSYVADESSTSRKPRKLMLWRQSTGEAIEIKMPPVKLVSFKKS